MTNRLRVLFVCSRNQWRSPTAEAIYRQDSRLEVRSGGLSAKSQHQVSRADLEWADLVLVMESAHKRRLRAQFDGVGWLPPIEVLHIPDDYQRMDPELVSLLRTTVEAVLEDWLG